MEGFMKAAIYKGAENIVVENIPIPACPADGVLVKVYACGICGSDVRNYFSGLKGGITEQIMGHEIAGKIIETNTSRFKVGGRVALAPDISCGYCWYCKRGLVNLCEHHQMLGTHLPGGFAQYVAIDGHVLDHGFIEYIPENLSYEEAAFAETAAAVIACQRYNNVSLGDQIVIIGDGPVACLHIEVARARGAGSVIVIGMDKLELVKRFSPDHVYKNDKPELVVENVMANTEGIGADIVICAVPTITPQQQALDMVRKRGRVILYGGVPQTAQMTTLNSNKIHYGEISIIGAFSYPSTGLSDALWAISHGKINAMKYMSAKVSLGDVVEGIHMIKKGKALKVMIDPWM